MPEQQSGTTASCGVIGYVLKGYPRLSEIFIASEIYRLEQAGVPVRIFVLRREEKESSPDVARRIRARVDYLPQTSSISEASALRWLGEHWRRFLPAVRKVAARHPARFMRTALAALAQAVRARRGWRLHKNYLKEFLQAVALSAELMDAPEVTHLHAHFCHRAATVAWWAARVAGLPFSFTAHAKDIYCQSLNPAGFLRRKLLAAKFAVTCTEANLRHLKTIAPEATVHCVYHGLNADFAALLQQAAPQSYRHHDSLKILAVGRLVPKKGFDVLVDACAVLRRRGVDVQTIIAGPAGEHEPEIRARIVQHGLDRRVWLPGALSQAQLFEAYRRASVFCLPCRVLENGDRDGIPNVLMEAMACGLPVVTTGISGIPEVIADGVNGLLVPPDDPQALADALMRVTRDSALAGRLARTGRATVARRFDGELLARGLAALYAGHAFQAVASPQAREVA